MQRGKLKSGESLKAIAHASSPTEGIRIHECNLSLVGYKGDEIVYVSSSQRLRSTDLHRGLQKGKLLFSERARLVFLHTGHRFFCWLIEDAPISLIFFLSVDHAEPTTLSTNPPLQQV